MVDPPDLPTPAGLPARPALRPGLRVVRRDDRHLQVGIDPPLRVIVPDDAAVRRLLDDLSAGRPSPMAAPSAGPAAVRCLETLHRHGLLVDAAALERSLVAGQDRAAAAAVFAQSGTDAEALLVARTRSGVRVDAAADVRQSAHRLLRAAGVGVTDQHEAGIVLLVAAGPLPRDLLDPFVRDGRAHVVVTPAGAGFTVGPFVAPGLTACLRCVDAHLGEHDPRRAVVLEQCGRQGPAGVEPRDPTLLALALAWAVRDVIRFVDGAEPATWSATVTIGVEAMPARRTWDRHPHCGCSWGDALVG
jgi:hypothetical protein